MPEKSIYIKAEQSVEVKNKKVFICDAIKIFGDDKNLVKELNGQVLFTVTEEKRCKYIFSILKIIEVLKQKHPDIRIENLGETDIIIEYQPPTKKKKLLNLAKIIFVCLCSFFGAAFTIMTFNEDVSVDKVFGLVYEFFEAERPARGGILEIAYAAGLPIGIAVFFNHFSKIKMNTDPTPLQVELRVYEEDLNRSIIMNAGREGKEKDV